MGAKIRKKKFEIQYCFIKFYILLWNTSFHRDVYGGTSLPQEWLLCIDSDFRENMTVGNLRKRCIMVMDQCSVSGETMWVAFICRHKRSFLVQCIWKPIILVTHFREMALLLMVCLLLLAFSVILPVALVPSSICDLKMMQDVQPELPLFISQVLSY